MRAKSAAMLAMWLVILAGAQIAAIVQLARFFVKTEPGQWLDTTALAGNYIGQDRIGGAVDHVLNGMSILSLGIAMTVIAFIAIVRRRMGLTFMTFVLILGANATTQVLKFALDRPNLGIDEERAAAGNSL